MSAQGEQTAQNLMAFDNDFRQRTGMRIIAGVDEVGRGSLAGPLVAAAVVLPANSLLSGLNDSKRLSARQRARLAAEITKSALGWAVAFVPAAYIDAAGLTAANMAAMRAAVCRLPLMVDGVLSDGYPIVGCPYINEAIVHGDALSQCIAAAACLAKVVRDAWMRHLGENYYPGYGWERNAGYATPEHQLALLHLGPTPQHRRLFLSGYRQGSRARQLSLPLETAVQVG